MRDRKDMTLVVVLKGQTLRDTTYGQDTKMWLSPMFAQAVISWGVARLATSEEAKGVF